MDWQALFSHYETQLEDFWGRRQNRPVYSREFTVFGHLVRIVSNFQDVLASAGFAQPLYSLAPEIDAPPFIIQLIVRSVPKVTSPLPENLFDHTQYSGHADWLAIQLGSWGHCQVDLAGKQALAVLAPELAERPALVSRYLLNTIITNFLIASGYGFLHTTGLLKERQVLLLLARHNSGKSTAALQLALAGYQLLSDSMIFVDPQGPPLRLYGFPVGRIKLRPDMVADFPQLEPLLEAEPVRGEIKYTADLRQLDPALVHEAVVEPLVVHLCLLTLGDEPTTHLRPASISEVMEKVMANSLYYDTARVWKQNLACIQPLVEQAHCYHLQVGSDPAGLMATIDDLWSS
jgi:hypothetical protein